MASTSSKYVSNIFKNDIFKNKVVFCTGGNGSICSAQVRALVHLGAEACIVGRNGEKTERIAKDIATARPGAKVIGIGSVDVRDIDTLQKAADMCVEQLGRIDFCIAGAAGNFLAPMSQLSANAFKTVIDIDLIGSYNCAKACLPHLITASKEHPRGKSTSPSGSIIFISATLHYRGTPLQSHACAAKAGVEALSNQICIEYGPFGVTSNVISPGPIVDTEGMERLAKNAREAMTSWKSIPLGIPGSVKNIADASVYLFSEAASYVNGETLVVDGGAWRTTSVGSEFAYPDFILEGSIVGGVGGMRRQKSDSRL